MSLGSIILITVVNPILLVVVAVLGAVCLVFRHVYLKTSKNIKRLEGTSTYFFTFNLISLWYCWMLFIKTKELLLLQIQFSLRSCIWFRILFNLLYLLLKYYRLPKKLIFQFVMLQWEVQFLLTSTQLLMVLPLFELSALKPSSEMNLTNIKTATLVLGSCLSQPVLHLDCTWTCFASFSSHWLPLVS